MMNALDDTLANKTSLFGMNPVDRLDHHRDRLVSLGALTTRQVPLDHVRIRTPAYSDLLDVLNGLDARRPAWQIPFEDPVVVHLWVPPEDVEKWMSAITAVDEAASGIDHDGEDGD